MLVSKEYRFKDCYHRFVCVVYCAQRVSVDVGKVAIQIYIYVQAHSAAGSLVLCALCAKYATVSAEYC